MSYIGTHGGNPNTSQALPASRYRSARPKRPQIGLHTSESPAGQRLLALWQFINRRSDHGSYNGGSDVYGTRNQYAPWSWYTWHAPSINPWACGLTANCRADEWDRISKAWRDNLINGLAYLAHQYSRWCVRQGLGPVQPRYLTRAQALRGESGFIYHGNLQSDRTDPTGPRNVFPRSQFLAEFRRLESGTTPAASTPVKEGNVMSAKEFWDYRGDDFVNKNAARKDNQLARVHEYGLNVWQRIRNTEWRAWLARGYWNHRGRDYVNNNPSTNDSKLGRAHQYGYLNRGNHQKLREIEAAQEAGFKALAEQLDSLKPGISKAVTDAIAKARKEQVDITAAEVAEQLKVDARITAKADEQEED